MLFSDDKYHLDKAYYDPDHESGGLQIEIPADDGNIQAVRVHGPYECFSIDDEKTGDKLRLHSTIYAKY